MQIPLVKKIILPFLIIILTCVATYWTSLNNGFLLDDEYIFMVSDLVQTPQAIWEEWKVPLKSNFYYRPFAHFTPRLMALLLNSNSSSMHAVNLAFFIFCVLLLYKLVNTLFDNTRLSLLTSLLFCMHPFNGMMVNYISANVFALQFIFLTSASLFFIKAISKKGFLNHILCWILFALACCCHESSFQFPLITLLISTLWKKDPWKKVARDNSVIILIAAVYFVLRLYIVSMQTVLFNKWLYVHMTPVEFLANFTHLILWYLKTFFNLKGAVLIWTVARNDVFVPTSLAAFVIIILLVGLSLFRVRRTSFSLPLLWFVSGWFLVAMGCVFKPKGGLMIEPHWLYFASIGLFILCAQGFLLIQSNINPLLGKLFMGVIFITMFVSSLLMNKFWDDQISYNLYWLEQDQNSNTALFFLGEAYFREGFPLLARYYLNQSFTYTADDWPIYNYLGLLDYGEEDYEEALRKFHIATTISADAGIVYNNIGLVYSTLGQIPLAIESFKKTIATNPTMPEARVNLASNYIQIGDLESAEKMYLENLQIHPYHKLTQKKLSAFYELYGTKQQRDDLLKSTLQEQP